MTRLALLIPLVLVAVPANAGEISTGARPYQPYGAGAPSGWYQRHKPNAGKIDIDLAKPCLPDSVTFGCRTGLRK